MPNPPQPASGIDDNTSVHYDKYQNISSYERFEGVVVMPVAYNGVPAEEPEVLRAFAPYNLCRVDWSAKKQGNPPLVPGPGYQGNEWANLNGGEQPPDPVSLFLPEGDWCVGSTVTVPQPSYSMDLASLIWSASGTYLYVTVNTQPLGFSSLPTGNTPFNDGLIVNVPEADRQWAAGMGIQGAPSGELGPYFSTVFPKFQFEPTLLVDAPP